MNGIPSLPEYLRFRQEQYGVTQKQMAEWVGMSTSHYSEALNGVRAFPFKALVRLYELGTPPDIIFGVHICKDKQHPYDEKMSKM